MMKQIAVVATVIGVLLMVAAQAGAGGFRQLVDDNDIAVLQGNVHPLARPEFDVGKAAATLPMERMILALAMRPEKKAALERLLVEQQDPGSPNFHHWLTPEEFGTRFGRTQEEIDLVVTWLTAHGFVIDEVAKGRTWINFSGTARDVERAFHTEIHDYLVDGEFHHANATDPSIPRAFSGVVAGVVSLHDFRTKTASHQVSPAFTLSDGSHWLAPADFATIYNVSPLYSAGIKGNGQSIAVVGRTNMNLSDVQSFRSTVGLPANDPQFVINGPDPGIVDTGEESEAVLDVEWSGAVAPKATILMVISKSTNASGGDMLSAQYIVNNNVAPVMTMSFYLCESSLGSSGNTFFNNLWSQAAALGISSFVCSGDSGAAACDDDTADTATGGQAVSGMCSTPYDVCVGGTEFLDSPASMYWSAANNSTTLASARSYIPEEAWNESANAAGGQELWSTGGGVSSVYSKPSWQVAPGVPNDGARDVPDVALAAAGHNCYFVVQQDITQPNSVRGADGTSAATPAFAGLMALVLQKAGARQGNPNTRLYQLGNAQYSGSGPAVFHDVTVGNNSVPGQAGFSCGTGFDLATGLGSVDASALANTWGGGGGGGGGGGTVTTIFSDNFGGSFPGSNWHLLFSGGSSTDQSVTWGKCSNRTYGSSASLWCAGGGTNAQPCGTQYLPNEGTWAVYGPFSLADATAATLDFDLWLQSEADYDYVKWMISVDGHNFYGDQTSGDSGGWVHKTLNFSDVTSITAVGAPQAWVGFAFTSDGSNQGEGAYIGNVVIKKTVAGPSCTYSLGSTSQSLSSSGGSGSFTVNASSSSCSWTAASNNTSWLNVTSGSSGTGNGTVGFSVAANTGSARTGTITAAGQTFTVNQSAGNVSYAYSYWLPVISHSQGSGGTQWRSDVGALNRSGSTASIEVVLYPGTGSLTATATIPGNGQAVFADLAAQMGMTNGSGALQVLSTQALLVTSRTYNLAASGFTYGQGYDGLASSNALGAGNTAWLPQLAQTGIAGQVGTSRVNIGITNTGSATASVTLTLYAANGAQVWSDTRSYAPGQFYQYQEPYRTGAGRTNIAAGYAKITVNSGSGIIAYASDIDNGSGDPTTVNMKQ